MNTTPVSHYNLKSQNHPTFTTCFDDTYFEDHLYLLEVSTFLEPKSQYSFDYAWGGAAGAGRSDRFQSINSELAGYE